MSRPVSQFQHDPRVSLLRDPIVSEEVNKQWMERVKRLSAPGGFHLGLLPRNMTIHWLADAELCLQLCNRGKAVGSESVYGGNTKDEIFGNIGMLVKEMESMINAKEIQWGDEAIHIQLTARISVKPMIPVEDYESYLDHVTAYIPVPNATLYRHDRVLMAVINQNAVMPGGSSEPGRQLYDCELRESDKTIVKVFDTAEFDCLSAFVEATGMLNEVTKDNLPTALVDHIASYR